MVRKGTPKRMQGDEILLSSTTLYAFSLLTFFSRAKRLSGRKVAKAYNVRWIYLFIIPFGIAFPISRINPFSFLASARSQDLSFVLFVIYSKDELGSSALNGILSDFALGPV